jgi:hypothetical protein
VVLISPKIVDFRESGRNKQKVDKVSHYQEILRRAESNSRARMSKLMDQEETEPDTETSNNEASIYPDDVLWFQDQ